MVSAELGVVLASRWEHLPHERKGAWMVDVASSPEQVQGRHFEMWREK